MTKENRTEHTKLPPTTEYQPIGDPVLDNSRGVNIFVPKQAPN